MLEEIVSESNQSMLSRFKYEESKETEEEISSKDSLIPLYNYLDTSFKDYTYSIDTSSMPDYMSLTESIRASFKPSYSNYLKDVMNKKIAFVNMPEVSAYGWVVPDDPETPIYINTAYANTDSQITKTIAHERNHVQTRTYHENPLQHELRVRVDTNTSYFS